MIFSHMFFYFYLFSILNGNYFNIRNTLYTDHCLTCFYSFAGEDRPRENVTGTADGQAAGVGAGAESGTGRQRLRCCVRVTAVQVRKAIWGVVMVICVCTSWAGSTQLAKLTFKQYDAPFTLTWFATTWNCLFFPLYYVGHLCKGPEKQSPKQRFR